MFTTEYSSLGGNVKDMTNTDSVLQVIREGLPVYMVTEAAQALNIGKTELGPLIGLSNRSMQRNKDKRLTPQQSEHPLALIRVLNESIEYFGEQDTALVWLKIWYDGINKES